MNERRSGHLPILLAAVAATGAGVLPMFLVAAMVVQIRADMALPSSVLGLALAVYYGVSAIGSVPGGRVVERLGWRRSVLVTGVLAALSLSGLALLARSAAQLTAFLALGGVANSLAQPAANLALVSQIRYGRQGLAFGVKQSAVPIAMLLSGIAVPTLTLTLGWRWAIALAACATLLACSWLSHPWSESTPQNTGATPRTATLTLPLLLLALGAALSAAGLNSLSAFLVDSAVAFGVTPATAGVVFAAGGAGGILTRLATGHATDTRWHDLLALVTVMLLISVLGFEFVARGEAGLMVLVLGTLVACSAGFGWAGPFNLAVVRLQPNAPAAATGVTQAGLWGGGILGPPVFGWVADTAAYPTAWRISGAFILLAAACVMVARHLVVRRSTDRPDAPPGGPPGAAPPA